LLLNQRFHLDSIYLQFTFSNRLNMKQRKAQAPVMFWYTANCIIIAPKRLKLRLSGSARKSQNRFRDMPRSKFQAVLARTQPCLSRSVEKRADQSRFKCRKVVSYYAIPSSAERKCCALDGAGGEAGVERLNAVLCMLPAFYCICCYLSRDCFISAAN
jgi:hypothetical protein